MNPNSDLDDTLILSEECYKKGAESVDCGCPFCKRPGKCEENSSHCHPCRPDRDQSINDLLQSIALMEASLAHILNGEGEKLQKAVKNACNICDLLAINKSINTTLINTTFLEQALFQKLEAIKCIETEK